MSNLDLLGRKISNFDALIDVWIAKLGIGYNHYAVLYTLADTTAQNLPCTQKCISEGWLIPKQTVFNICKDYKEKGWLVFGENPADKRERILHLTESGKAQALPVWQASRELGDSIFTRFGEEKTAQMFALMDEFCEIGRLQIEQAQAEQE